MGWMWYVGECKLVGERESGPGTRAVRTGERAMVAIFGPVRAGKSSSW